MSAHYLVIHGPNLNMLGKREPDIYGDLTLDALNEQIRNYAKSQAVEVSFEQSNDEADIINAIHNAEGRYNGIIINPAAYSHYSIAIRDALSSVKIEKVEVHLSNIHAREEFRHNTVTGGACTGIISGFGPKSYFLAIEYLSKK